MKHAKKLLALVMVLAMVLSLGITAFAAEENEAQANGTITFKADGHKYAIYQIFTGQMEDLVNSEGKTVRAMTYVRYGQNAKGTQGTLVDDTTLSDVSAQDSAALAAYIEDKLLNKENPYNAGFTPVESGLSLTVPVGYYYIEDLGLAEGNNSEDFAISKIVVEVVDNEVRIEPKRSGTPTTEKKVKDINDSTEGALSDWKDSADHDIGDTIPFRIAITVPDGYEAYKEYKMIVHDTQSKGLTFVNGSLKVKYLLNGNETDVASEQYNLALGQYSAETGTEFTITFPDVKKIQATGLKTIYIYYDAKLNENAVIGSKGNPNEMYLEYSNNPNSNSTGKTEKDTVIVFTYQTEVNKIDQDGKPLTGAAFTLYKKYISVPEGKEATPGVGNEGENFVKVKEYVVNDDVTKFGFTGLDDGDYILVETTVPSGYNKADDIRFTINATHSDDDQGDGSLKLLAFSGEKTSGNADITDNTAKENGANPKNEVVNKKGVELPSTGGIGTTIFYVVGSMMMLAAAVLLITRKKMSAYQD